MTVVDSSCYGRSDSTRRPSLATLCKRRPGQGGSGVVVWEGWAWIAVMMTMSALASSVVFFFFFLMQAEALRVLEESMIKLLRKNPQN